MTDINQSLRQASIRAVTSTTYDYNGDWHALFDLYGIPAGDLEGRRLIWLNAQLGTTYTTISEAKAAYAASLSLGQWEDIGTFTIPALFAPADLGTATKAWMTADDHGTGNMTDDGSGVISQWKSHDGSALTVTAATTARPTWTSNLITKGDASGSLAGISFDGVANCFVSTTLTNIPTGSTAGDIMAFFGGNEALGAGVGHVICRYGGTTGGTLRSMQLNNGASIRSAVSSDATVSLIDTAVDIDGNYHAIDVNYSGTTQAGRVNGRDFSPASGTIGSLNTSTTRIRIGAANGAGAASFGKIKLRHLFIGSYTAAQRIQLEAWGLWEAGSQSQMPSTHRYRYAKP